MAELLQWRCDRPPTPQPLAAPRVWATRRRLRCVRAACGGWGVQRQRWAARHVRSKSEEAGAGGLFSSAPMRESRAPRRLPPRPHSNSRVQARMRFGRWSVRFLGDAARGRAQPGPRRGLLGCIDGVLGLVAPPTAPLPTPFGSARSCCAGQGASGQIVQTVPKARSAHIPRMRFRERFEALAGLWGEMWPPSRVVLSPQSPMWSMPGARAASIRARGRRHARRSMGRIGVIFRLRAEGAPTRKYPTA